MTEIEWDRPEEAEVGPVVDPNPEGGIGGDESESVPPDSQPVELTADEPDDSDEPDEPDEPEPDGEVTEAYESLGDAPEDEDIPEDEGDAGGEGDGGS